MFRYILCLILLLTVQPGAALAAHTAVLFDQGHGQAFTIEQEGELHLSGLANIFGQTGLRIDATEAPLTRDLLKPYAGLVISGAFRAHTPEEVAAIRDFVHDGGRVAVMLHIARPLWPLLDALGVHVANGVLHERQGLLDDTGINFGVGNLAPHPLTAGLQRFNLYGGWPLRPAGDHAVAVAFSSDHAWVDLNRDKQLNRGDAMQKFAVIVTGRIGRGEFVVFADDALFQNRFLTAANRKLAENLAYWLKGTTRNRQLSI